LTPRALWESAKLVSKSTMRNSGVVLCELNQWIHGSSFLFPAELILWNCGSGRDEEPSGEEAVLRQIQIRLATPSLQKSTPACQDKF
jgi:hypothetical protein